MALTNLEFYAIQPKEATNLIANPSFETGTTGYSVTNGTISQDATQQRRGIYSLKIIPSSGFASNVRYSIAVTNGAQYSFSADVLDVDTQAFKLYVVDSTVATIATVSWTGNGRWKRRSITFTANANTPFALIFQRDSVASTTPFYTDGWLFEAGALSSYFDGDMKGFVRGQVDYFWNGTPHASTSFRSGQTRSGGTEVRLKDYLRILAVFGLGMAPVINNSLPNVRGGAFFQNSVYDSRTISLSTAITGTTEGALLKNRAAIAAAINVRQTQSDQPMILRIKGLDSVGVEQAETVDAIVQYSGGLGGSLEAGQLEQAPLQFTQFLPYLTNEAEVGQGFTIYQSIANPNRILKRDVSGTWQTLSTGANNGVYAIIQGQDGTLYAGGAFTLMAGVANTAYIAKWNGTTWTPLGTGMTGGAVQTLVIGPDGTLYAGGAFTGAGGVANTAYIAKWNGSAWSALGTGVTAGSIVNALAMGPDGTLYAGGGFTSMSGVANTAYIAKWDGSNWNALSTGMNGAVYSLVVGLDGTLYAGGSFTLAGGIANTVKIAKWNGSWTPLNTGSNGTWVMALAVGPNGYLYAGGDFTAIGGVTTRGIAVWNGVSWRPLGSGLADGMVQNISVESSGNIYVMGTFSAIGGISTANNSVAIWNGSSWVYFDISHAAGTNTYSIYWDKSFNLYIGYDGASAVNVPLIQTVTNTAGYATYPRIILTGPGTVYQIKNVTSRKTLFFNLNLLEGETAVLDLDPFNPKFTSSFRGNIINTILPGSNMDMSLFPGSNSISVLMVNASGTTTCSFVWKPLYPTYDQAVY